jgi:hypothetical protein
MASKKLPPWLVIVALSCMLSLGCSSWDKFISKVGSRRRVGVIVEVPPGRKLVDVAWKYGDLWILTRPAEEGERADREWMLDEHSNWGVFNNHILLRETPR